MFEISDIVIIPYCQIDETYFDRHIHPLSISIPMATMRAMRNSDEVMNFAMLTIEQRCNENSLLLEFILSLILKKFYNFILYNYFM